MINYSKENNASRENNTKLKMGKNFHGATRYVQNAVEGAVKTSHDATQNLVNKTMKRDPANFKN